jgi:hypothetical protein
VRRASSARRGHRETRLRRSHLLTTGIVEKKPSTGGLAQSSSTVTSRPARSEVVGGLAFDPKSTPQWEALSAGAHLSHRNQNPVPAC